MTAHPARSHEASRVVRRRTPRALLVLALCVASPNAVARAGDGVVEINHAAALAGSVTPGDAPGYPVSIAGPGSYRLTGGLTPPAGQSAIVMTGSFLSLDLNGFSIRGTAICSGSPVTSCTAHGGDGILHVGSSDSSVAIRNGSIQGMRWGVFANPDGMTIESVHAVGNELEGIRVSSFATVSRCRAAGNGRDGIATDGQSLVVESETSSNGGTGIALGSGSIATRNRTFNNWLSGISSIASGWLNENVVRTNNISQNPVLGGIFANSLGVQLVRVSDNVMSSNGQGDLKGPAVSSAGDNVCTNVGC